LQNFFLERYTEAYRREMRHFVDILRDGVTPMVGYRDGVASLVLAEAAALSVKRNAPINVASV
jgi:myo-inositol 2-dehydrogenase / D-chiro-inositol 1-dehydrogenase